MGLDQYAYVASKAGERNEFYKQDLTYNTETGDWDVPAGGIAKPREIAYWRKHPNLQGWMRKLWEAKGTPGCTPDADFNGSDLELTWEDLDMLEEDVQSGNLPKTAGFFFGNDSDEYYKEHDLKFIRQAKAELLCGLKVFYDSSW
jgi:hypothetical protein